MWGILILPIHLLFICISDFTGCPVLYLVTRFSFLATQPSKMRVSKVRTFGLVWGIRFCQMRLLRRIGFQVPLLKLPQMDRHNTPLVFLAAELAFHEYVSRE